MMRHVSRTHRVASDWLFDRINLDPKIHMKYVDTKNQLADMLTKRSFTRDEWCHLLRMFNFVNLSIFSCCHFLSIKKGEHHVEESSGKEDRRRACGSGTKADMFDFPGESRVGFKFCFRERKETCAE